MPVDAPEITRRECVAAGAELYLVDGLIDHAGALVKAAVEERSGYQEVSTLKEPYRIEGKKTMGYEIVEQLGWRVPDVILYPTGGGVGPDRHPQGDAGAARARLDRRAGCRGWSPCRRPAARRSSTRSSAGATRARLAGRAHTLAFGINVPEGARRLPGAATRRARPAAPRSR